MHWPAEIMRRHVNAPIAALLVLVVGGCDLFSDVPDERAPTVEIVRPGERNVVGSVLRVRIAAAPRRSDENFVSFVNVTVNGKHAGEAAYVEGTTDPYEFVFEWNTFDFEDGEYRIEATAFDKFQARGLSNPVRVVVQNVSAGDGPMTEVIAPRDGDGVTGVQRIIAEPRLGEPSIQRLDFLIDGATVASMTSPPYSFDWDTTEEPRGDHVIRIRAFSAENVFRYSDPVTVSVERSSEEDDPTETEAVFMANGLTGEVKGSVAIGFNDDLYIGTLTGQTRDTLYAFSPSGTIRWRAVVGPIRSSAVVGNNEDVFITAEDGRLYGFTSAGRSLWPAYSTGAGVRASPALGIEGGLFFGDSEGRVHAVNSFDGLSLPGWPVPVTNVAIVVPPVITRDRTVIVAATDGHVYALRPDGRLLWRSPTNVGSVGVGVALVEREFEITLPNGNVARSMQTVVYVVSNAGRIYAMSVDTNGSVLWDYPIPGPLRSAPVVGPDGTIYVGTSTGLYALNEEIDQFTPRLRFVHVADDVGTPAIDSNENVYFASKQRIIALNPNNMPLWEYDLRMQADGPLTIGRNGLLYVAGNNGVLFGLRTNSVGLARGKWPMYQRNSRHTGRLGIDATDG